MPHSNGQRAYPCLARRPDPVPIELLAVRVEAARRGAVIAEALRHAGGDYVVILDDGDGLAPRALAMALVTLVVGKADLVAGLRVVSNGSVDVVPCPLGRYRLTTRFLRRTAGTRRYRPEPTCWCGATSRTGTLSPALRPPPIP